MSFIASMSLFALMSYTASPEEAQKKEVKPAEVVPERVQVTLTDYEQEILHQAINNCFYWKKANKTPGATKQAMLRDFILIERRLNFPHEARGLLLAAACMESAYKPTAKGDSYTKFQYAPNGKDLLIDEKTGRPVSVTKYSSHGVMQQARWWKKRIRRAQAEAFGIKPWKRKDPRYDPLAAAYAWGERFLQQLVKAKKLCTFVPWQWKGKRYAKKYGTLASRYVAVADAYTSRGITRCLRYTESTRTRSGWRCAERQTRCFERTKHHRELTRWRQAIEAKATQLGAD